MIPAKASQSLPEGHVLLPAATIAGLSILLAVGLGVLRILDRIEHAAAALVLQGKSSDFPKEAPSWALWLAAALLAFGLALSILGVSGTWRRSVLWATSVILVLGWAPVLVLAARSPDIGAPLIAVFWSGLCAMVYARNHRMAVDEISTPEAP